MNDEHEKAVNEVRKLFQKKGEKILEEMTADILREKIKCDETKNALHYFASYWRDVVRPSLISLACEAVGGDPSTVTQIGKSLSFLSGATDIHDDIIDRTVIKDKRDTVLGRFGHDIALLAGDILIFKGFSELFEGLMKLNISPKKKLLIVRTVKELYYEMCDGESMELRFKGRTDVEPDEYLQVVRKKAADIEALMRIGAILGGGSTKQIKTLGEYGRLLGMIVLLRNDLEDLLDFDIGLCSRVKNESLPLPVIYALKNEKKRADILAILKKGEIRGSMAERLLELISEAGGFDKLWSIFKSLNAEANKKFENKTLKTILTAAIPSDWNNKKYSV